MSAEMKVAFDAEPKTPAEVGELGKADGAEFWASHAKIAKAPNDGLVIGGDLGK